MITHHNPLHARLQRQPRVRRALHALQHNRQRGVVAHPRDVGPAERRVDVAAHQAAHAAAAGVVAGARAAHGGGEGRVGGDALVGFALAGDGRVDREEDRTAVWDGGGEGEEGEGLGALRGEVELQEEGVRGGRGGGDGGERVGGVG